MISTPIKQNQNKGFPAEAPSPADHNVRDSWDELDHTIGTGNSQAVKY